ncbi:DUF6481 family protein [Sphingomonas sp. 37zxx]|uniref:DUF6481 family protein n=1 Tax=Sphingomonas sp. 37zxx TaxID=1550073 RepID=UPI00053BED7C|nr:DUF6481 family protein [Sphingomonas sp. 37zxx]
MSAYKAPDFQERQALSKQAKEKALEKLRAKPPMDPAVVAERLAAAERREAAAAERQREKIAAKEAAEAEKLTKAAEAEAAILQAAKDAEQAEIDKKAARDARYAARKQRK